MAKKNIIIRSEKPGDYESIRIINILSFGQKQEAELIDKLRRRAEFNPGLSLIAFAENNPVGHILFFPVSISAGKSHYPTLSLGPMAVLPEYQKKGIGGELILTGLRKAGELNYKSVVVLGHPDYYPRFGFRKSSLWNIRDPFDAPEEAMMAIELVNGSLDFGGGIIDYPVDFYDAV